MSITSIQSFQEFVKLERVGQSVGGSTQEILTIPTIKGNDLKKTLFKSIYVHGQVTKMPVKWLLDTGASCSVISSSIPGVKKLKLEEVKNCPRGADGRPLDCLGKAKVPIRVGPKTVDAAELYVVNDLPAIAILGVDILQSMGHKITIDWKERKLQLDDDTIIDIDAKWNNSKSSVKVYVAEDVTVCDGKENIIWAVGEEITTVENDTRLFEPYPAENLKQGLLAGRCVVKLNKQNRFPIRLIGVENGGMLNAGTCIGELNEVDRIINNVGCTTEPDLTTNKEMSQDSWKINETECKAEDVEELKDLLQEFDDIFARQDSELGELGKEFSFELKTLSDSPIYCKPRRVPHFLRTEIQEQVRKMKANNIIRPSNSPWASPVLLVKKPNGSYRFACDYRTLNKNCESDAYPIGELTAAQNTLLGAKYFSTLDLRCGYHQVPMTAEASRKSAFITQDGLYEFLRMPYGLKNAPAHFTRLMNRVLSGLIWKICLVYLDDIIIWGRTPQEHLRNLKSVFERLRKAGLTLRPDKCSFMSPQVRYLGHLITQNGYKPDPEKVAAMKHLKSPEDVNGVKRVVGMFSFYRKFIPNMAVVCKPVTDLLKKNTKFAWSTECEMAFRKIIEILCTCTTLAFPNFEEKFILTTDASKLGLGAVLSQCINGEEVPIAFSSRVLRGAEANWSARELETLGIVWAVEYFREYLYGKQFKLNTDHHSLQWLLKLKNPQGKMARWVEKLAEYDMEISYLPGCKNVVADVLSRHINQNPENTAEEYEKDAVCNILEENMIEKDVLLAAQKSDEVMKKIRMFKRTGHKPDIKTFPKEYMSKLEYCFIDNKDDLLKIKFVKNRKTLNQVLVPEAIIPQVLELCHDKMGHFGTEKTFHKVQKYFYFEQVYSSTKKWCETCEICNRRKGGSKNTVIRERERVTAPWQIMDLDLMGPLPKTDRGNKYIVGCIDRFSKFLFTAAVPDKRAETIAKEILKVNYRVGFVEKVHADNGKEFDNKIFEQALGICKIQQSSSLPYTPHQNGLIERSWRSLTDRLGMLLDTTGTDWDLKLDLATLQCNTSLQSSIKETPFFVSHGRQAHFGTIFKTGEDVSIDDYTAGLKNVMPGVFKQIIKKEDAVMRKRTTQSERKCKKRSYQEGDLVWYKRNVRKTKFEPKWEGPYTILKILSEVTVRLKQVGKRKRILCHISKLKPCQQRETVLESISSYFKGNPIKNTNTHEKKARKEGRVEAELKTEETLEYTSDDSDSEISDTEEEEEETSQPNSREMQHRHPEIILTPQQHPGAEPVRSNRNNDEIVRGGPTITDTGRVSRPPQRYGCASTEERLMRVETPLGCSPLTDCNCNFVIKRSLCRY